MPRISELPFPSSGPLNGDEVLVGNQGGETVQINVNELVALTIESVVESILNSSALDSLNAPIESMIIPISDETTALTSGAGKLTFRMPYAFTLTENPRASLTVAQTSGSVVTVDINESGSTILSTKLTIDNTEKTSTTAATPPVLSDSHLADDAEMTIDIDTIGDGTAKGLKITLIGRRG